MRIGMDSTPAEVSGKRRFSADSRFEGRDYSRVMGDQNRARSVERSRLIQLEGTEREETVREGEKDAEPRVRSEAEKIYQAAVNGKKNPIENLRQNSKVPYGYLAKDGVIEYNGVCFVCDEKTNSICLGDMTDEKNVLIITLSGGGHLKVHRDSLGALSKAVGMFSPEDLNLIMRAIAQDTKIQSVKQEIEDEKAGVGSRQNTDGSASGDGTAEPAGPSEGTAEDLPRDGATADSTLLGYSTEYTQKPHHQ